MDPTTQPAVAQAAPTLDPKMARKLLRNLRILNTIVVLFSLIIIGVFAVTGILAYKILTEVKSTKDSFTSLTTQAQDNLDFKNQLCSSTGSLKLLLEKQSNICN